MVQVSLITTCDFGGPLVKVQHMMSHCDKSLNVFVIHLGDIDRYLSGPILANFSRNPNVRLSFDYMRPQDYDELIEFLKTMINRADAALIIQSIHTVNSNVINVQVAEAIKRSNTKKGFKVIRIVIDNSEAPPNWQTIPGVSVAEGGLERLITVEHMLGVSVPRLFVSHTYSDVEYCDELAEGLKAYGFDVWYDNHSMNYGTIRAVIERELETREFFIVVLSPEATNSDWVNSEIDAALELLRAKKMKLFLPVIAVKCSVPLLLRRFKRVEGRFGASVIAKEAAVRVAKAVESAK